MGSQQATDAYEGMRTRRHWKREDAARVLSDWASSGEPLTAFARRHNLSMHRLQWWRTQLAQTPESHAQAVRLIPVVPVQAPLIGIDPQSASVVSVTIGAARLEINDPGRTDPRWLAALVSELRGGHS
jgi:transposase-like protein